MRNVYENFLLTAMKFHVSVKVLEHHQISSYAYYLLSMFSVHIDFTLFCIYTSSLV